MLQASSPLLVRLARAGAVAAALAALAVAAPAAADPASRPGSPLLGGIDEVVSLPGGAWKAVRSGERLLYVSDNGRFVVEGRAYDLWAGRPLESFADVREATRTVKLKGFDTIWDDLAPIVMGEGEHELAVFMDPNCPQCHGLLAALEGISDRVSVKVIPLPLLGEDSGRKVRAMHCAADRDAAAEAVLGRADPFALPQDQRCALDPLHRRLVTAQLIGLRGVPFMIRLDDGRFVEGMPRDLASWVEGG